MNTNIKRIKGEVKHLIKSHSVKEVTSNTNHATSGIYLLYIDHFTNESVIPIYIGKSANIQKSYKEHLIQILALNRLSYDDYYKYFFSNEYSYYEGKINACKIFKYMLENDCTLNDFRMIIIEEITGDQLDKREQAYIQKLSSSFVGFNEFSSYQYNLKVCSSKETMNLEEFTLYIELLLKDLNEIDNYFHYGYTYFNFAHYFSKDISYFLEGDFQLTSTIQLKIQQFNRNLNLILKKYNLETELEVSKQKHRIFSKYQEEYENEHSDYIEKSRQQSGLLKRLIKIIKKESINKTVDNFQTSSNEKLKLYMEAFDDWKKYTKTLRHQRCKMIFPNHLFSPFQLEDKSNVNIKSDNPRNAPNTCTIKLDMSNSESETSKHPFIIRACYRLIDMKGNVYQKQHYIRNESTLKCQHGIKYIEKDFGNIIPIEKQPFSITSKSNQGVDQPFITLLAEYNHGINDYTLKKQELVPLQIVFNEIEQLINENTRFKVKTPIPSNYLIECIKRENIKVTTFIEKLLSTNY
ncbi:GIY-YIG nuclease family protein [Halalkalibacter hemicellulosilyticus]|uniref:GIY-YIG domain-containing protein n=1 Tax=Halalkalibacter hemicellulosilyticusJCM 9152 TaxID=1236971 RepID=W4QH33_9BACI|nr:GIY-YIG nuclease family protein [Halalkalibacter hemicellulosilyticus]GAE30938.1 hypothetical protein JCM9152_2371 [Halalkalibacter hemicellulosilyticusJCM 9152]